MILRYNTSEKILLGVHRSDHLKRKSVRKTRLKMNGIDIVFRNYVKARRTTDISFCRCVKTRRKDDTIFAHVSKHVAKSTFVFVNM